MTKLITPEIRANFCNVMEPKAFSADQEPKYSVVIAIDKGDKFWGQLEKAMEEVAITKWGEYSKKIKTFIKEYTDEDEEEKYGWAGCKVFTASNKNAPGVLMKTAQGLVEPTSKDDIYSGCMCRVALRPYAYEYNKTKGIAISLDNFLKTGPGERFTSKTSPQEDFKDFIDTEVDWD